MATTQATQGYVVLTGIAEREGGQFVSYCRELGTTSCGATADEALQNLGDAIDVHLHGLSETGQLETFLRDRNIRVHPSPALSDLSVRVPAKKLVTIYECAVPLAA